MSLISFEVLAPVLSLAIAIVGYILKGKSIQATINAVEYSTRLKKLREPTEGEESAARISAMSPVEAEIDELVSRIRNFVVGLSDES